MLQDFVLETCSAPGTASTVTLAGAASGRRTFAQAFSSGVNAYYFMDDGTQAEWGWGVFTAGTPNTITRGTVLGNTAGSTVRLNFAGSTRIYNMLPSARIPWLGSNGDIGFDLYIPNNSFINARDNTGTAHGMIGCMSDNLVHILGGPSGFAVSNNAYNASNLQMDDAGNTNIRGFVTAASAMTTGNVQAGTGTNSGGYKCRSGATGAIGSNVYNLSWNGTQSTLWIDSTSVGTISTTSDGRYKHSVADLPGGALDQIMSLRPVTYRWRNQAPFIDNGETFTGFVAQDVHGVVPAAVTGDPSSDETMSLRPVALIAILTKAIQELTAEFHAYKAAHP